MNFKFRYYCFLPGLTLLAVLLTGCGGGGDPNVVEVEGTVTMDGKPLPKATVLFISGQGRPSGAITDDAGHYRLNYTADQAGARVGKNRIQITTAQGPLETEDGTPIPPVRESVPTKYNTESTLEFQVVQGKKNIADFALDSKGKITKE